MRIIYLTLIITFALLFSVTQSTYTEKLKFKNKQFKILQLTDLHYGENDEKDYNSTLLQEKLIDFAKPDIVILTGDMVSGYAWDKKNQTFYQDLWRQWSAVYERKKMPYAYALGNHDDQANYSREQIYKLLEQNHPYSLMIGSTNITGISNFYLPILNSQDKIATLLWIFDSNDEGCKGYADSWGCIDDTQINWFKKQKESIKSELNYLPRGLAFFHIPLVEYKDLYNFGKTYGKRYEGVSCPRVRTNIFDEMLNEKSVIATFCGHDHNNYFGGHYMNVELVFGRKTGYGGYGPKGFQRGARLITLTEEDNGSFSYVHQMIEEDLTVVENDKPTWKGFFDYVGRCDR